MKVITIITGGAFDEKYCGYIEKKFESLGIYLPGIFSMKGYCKARSQKYGHTTAEEDL